MQLNTLSNEEKIISVEKAESLSTMKGFIIYGDLWDSQALGENINHQSLNVNGWSLVMHHS